MKWWMLILGFIFTRGIEAKDILLLTDSQYPPYSYEENGRAVGLYVELVEQVAARLTGYNVSIQPLPWQTAKHELRNGDADGLIGVYFHGEKWPYMYPYSSRLAQEQVWTACKSSREPEGVTERQWPDNYKNTLITHVAGYDGWLSEGIRSERNTSMINFIEVPNMVTGMQMAEKGIADCALVETVAFRFVTQRQSDEFASLNLTTLIDRHDVFIGYAKSRSTDPSQAALKEFMKDFDAQLKTSLIAGQLDVIYEKYQHPTYH